MEGFSEKPSTYFFICLYFIGVGKDENLKKIFGMGLSVSLYQTMQSAVNRIKIGQDSGELQIFVQ